jgi:hypothetical protein
VKKNLLYILLYLLLCAGAILLNSCNKKAENQAVYYQNCRADSIELIISGVNTLDLAPTQIVNYESGLPQVGRIGVVSSIKNKHLTEIYRFTITFTNLLK